MNIVKFDGNLNSNYLNKVGKALFGIHHHELNKFVIFGFSVFNIRSNHSIRDNTECHSSLYFRWRREANIVHRPLEPATKAYTITLCSNQSLDKAT